MDHRKRRIALLPGRCQKRRSAHHKPLLQRRCDLEHLGLIAEVEQPPDAVDAAIRSGNVDFAPGEPEGGAFVAAGGLDLQQPLPAVRLERPV